MSDKAFEERPFEEVVLKFLAELAQSPAWSCLTPTQKNELDYLHGRAAALAEGR